MMENAIIIGFVLLVCVLMDVIILILSKIWPVYHPSEVKTSRWEAGNIPIRHPKYTLPMQYFGFMFMFMAVEPILVILFIFSAYPSVNFYLILLLSLLLLLPALYVGYKISIEMAYEPSTKEVR
jgi:NADH-quinone oxidoreductase subunit A